MTQPSTTELSPNDEDMRDLIKMCEIWSCFFGVIGLAIVFVVAGYVWGVVQIKYPYIVEAVKHWFCLC